MVKSRKKLKNKSILYYLGELLNNNNGDFNV